MNHCKAGKNKDKGAVIQVCSVAIYLSIGVDSSRTLCLLESENFAYDEMRLAFMLELSFIKKAQVTGIFACRQLMG